MATTRSTAAERMLRRPGKAPGILFETRSPERACLLAASVVTLLGLILVYRAKTYPLAGFENQFGNKQLLNLNEVTNRGELLPFLRVFDHPADRQFAAHRIFEYLREHHSSPVPNVGALARIRVGKKQIDSTRGLDVFRKRLAQLRARESSQEHTPEPTLPLLTFDQLSQLKPLLIVRRPDQFRQSFWLSVILYLASFHTLHLVWRMRGFNGDRLILPVIHLLTGLGLVAMVSLRDPLRDTLSLVNFSQGVILGCALMLPLSFLDYQRLLSQLSFVPLLLSFCLSMLLIIGGTGPGGSDAKVNLFGFQPVEVIKILLVLFLAGYFAERWEFLRELEEKRHTLPFVLRGVTLPRLEYVAPVLISLGLALLFFFLQKDLAPALVMSCLFLGFYGTARNRLPMVLTGLLLMISGFWLGYQLGFPRTVSERIQMWLSPWDNPVRGGDQLAHSLWALASGGMAGTGLGLGDPEIVPAAHTDLILTVFGEELGFLGLLSIFVLFAVLVYRCMGIALKAPSDYTFFLSLGLTMLIALPTLLISAGMLGLVPLSGIASPFLSYGRSSMLANFMVLAILLSISARSPRKEQTGPFRKPVMALIGFMSTLAVVIIAKAAYVEVFRSNDTLVASTLIVQADGARRFQYNPRMLQIARQIPRGSIYDRNGIPLATSRWDELEKHRQQYEQLGVYVDQESSRFESRHYPFGGRTFHLLGDWRTRLNWGASNTSFEERDSNRQLQGYDDKVKIVEITDPRTGNLTRILRYDYGELIPLLRYRYQPGREAVKRILNRNRNLRMSIDIRLQLRVAEILKIYLRRIGREKGAAVIMDPETGDLLACVSYPYPRDSGPIGTLSESGEVSESTEEALLDRARYGLYPPGSTFKIVTAMAALRTSPRIRQETFQCEPLPGGRVGNYVRGWKRPIRDDVADKIPHGTVDLEKGLIVSCNAYFAQMATYLVGPEALRSTADLLGIKVASPNTPEKLRQALPQAAYGQGQVVATPFQMARVAATIANGGKMAYGRWVLDDSNSRAQGPTGVLNRNLADEMAQFMRGVVTRGTGRRLSAVQPPIAGKTGTAELEDAASHAWFAGFSPYAADTQKRIAFCVLVENGQYGGSTAAPLAGEIVTAARDLGIIQ